MEPYQLVEEGESIKPKYEDIIVAEHPMDYENQLKGITRELKRLNDEGNKNAVIRGATDAVLAGISGIAGSTVSTIATSLLLHKLLKDDKPQNIE